MEEIVPLWLKLAYTLMVAIVVVAYWRSWGPKNFLWISDVALFGLLLALWLESGDVASVMAVMALLVEIAWLMDLLVRLVSGRFVFGLTNYMFSDKQPLLIRLLSLFHIPMLMVMLYMLYINGYSSEAVRYAIPLVCVLFIVTRIARPDENINWVYGWSGKKWQKEKPVLYITTLIIIYSFGVIVPTHFLLEYLAG